MPDDLLAAKDYSPIKEEQSGFDPDWLQELARLWESEDESLVVRLGGDKRSVDPLVYCDRFGVWRTGAYIGDVQYRGRTLRIEPRFPADISEWLAEVLNLEVVPDLEGTLTDGPFLDRLLAVMWGSGFVRAAKHGLPFLRGPVRHVGYTVRGRPKVRETAALQGRGQPKLVSEMDTRSLDNPIVRTAVAAYQTLRRRLSRREIKEDEWIPGRCRDLIPAMERACGYRPSVPSAGEIRRIRYTPITESYRSFVRLSEQIARMRSGRPKLTREGERVSGLLIDVAELWELYVVNTARSALTEVEVVHGTAESRADWVLGRNQAGRVLQSLMPDLLLRRNGSTAAVGDAKYKSLSTPPRSGPHWGYEYDDLYQLVTYLRELTDGPVEGLLIYPQLRGGSPARLETDGPWSLQGNAKVRFLAFPRQRSEARVRWQEVWSSVV